MTIFITASPIFLPKDIIFDMLSYLPVKSLLRYKCVSKLWNAITLDFQFICLHIKRSPMLIYKEPPHDQINDFKLVCSGALLVEDATGQFPQRYRVRNPALNQILELPDSQNYIWNVQIVVEPDYLVVKLLSAVYVYVVKYDQVELGYEVLDLRNEENSTYFWRPLIILQEKCCKRIHKCGKQVIFFHAMGTAYCMWETLGDFPHIGIDILDMVNDSYIGHTTLPKDFYSKHNYADWNGKLSFARIVKEELHVLVLDDYKKQEWAKEKLIIKLTHMGKSVPEQRRVFRVLKSKVYFCWWDKKSICKYDITTGKVTTILCGYGKTEFVTIPCLLGFKGSAR